MSQQIRNIILKKGLEAFCIKGNAQAPLIKNYSINSAKWTYGCSSFPELPGAFRLEQGNDSIHRHPGTRALISIFPSNLVYMCVCFYFDYILWTKIVVLLAKWGRFGRCPQLQRSVWGLRLGLKVERSQVRGQSGWLGFGSNQEF